MPQIAQQDYFRVKFTGAFSAMDADTKAILLQKKKEGSIYDCIIESSTEGESRVLGVYDTVASGAITKTEISVCKASAGTIEKVTIYQA